MTVRNKNESIFEEKEVILKYIIFCFVLLISLPNLAEDEVIIDENFFKDIDTSKFREKLPPKVEAQDLIDNVFIDRDNDGVDDFLEHVIAEKKIEDKKVIRSSFEYMFLTRIYYKSCNESLESTACELFSYTRDSYFLKCRKIRISELFTTLFKRLKLSIPLRKLNKLRIKFEQKNRLHSSSKQPTLEDIKKRQKKKLDYIKIKACSKN